MTGRPARVFWVRLGGTRFPVRRGETIVGRSPYCTIVVANSLASRQHAALRLGAGSLRIEDLGSSNGTHVNGERIDGCRELAEGDVIRIGTDLLTVEVGKLEERAGAATIHGSDERDEATTRSSVSGTELVRSVVEGAELSDDREALLPAVRSVIEGVVVAHARDERIIDQDSIRAIRESIEKVAGWSDEAALGKWRARLLAALDQE